MKPSSDGPSDPLAYLQRRPVIEYPKGALIYSGNCDGLYLVAAGRVKLASGEVDGRQAMTRIVPAEEFFGECSLIERTAGERATALSKVQIMMWGRAEIEQQIEKEPGLGLALMQKLLLVNLEMQDRLHVMATCKTPKRVMFSLLQLVQRLGQKQLDGSIQMPGLTHEAIAEYVGTSREIVSSEMNRLRRLGLIRYSRREIQVYCSALENALRSGGFTVRPMAGSFGTAVRGQLRGQASGSGGTLAS